MCKICFASVLHFKKQLSFRTKILMHVIFMWLCYICRLLSPSVGCQLSKYRLPRVATCLGPPVVPNLQSSRTRGLPVGSNGQMPCPPPWDPLTAPNMCCHIMTRGLLSGIHVSIQIKVCQDIMIFGDICK